MTSRLAASTSPYLQQHAGNPVDWYPWGDEALAAARERDVPLLVSVGYAACHWCHVMAHESFEDAGVAEAVNSGFVAVKVDREERPDVDAVYMNATTALTGHGGWPMTCVLTPDGDPFFAGTYFPRAQLLSLLANVTQVWAQQRSDVLASGAHIAGRLREMTAPSTAAPCRPTTNASRAPATSVAPTSAGSSSARTTAPPSVSSPVRPVKTAAATLPSTAVPSAPPSS